MKGHTLIKRCLVCLLALAVALGVLTRVVPERVQAASSGEIKAQINQLESEQAELEAQIEMLEQSLLENLDQIEDTVAQKKTLDEQIFLLHEQIANINEQISSYSVLIADQQDELDDAEARYTQLSDQNRDRVRAMEENGTLSYWSVLFKAGSFTDLLDRLNMIEEINAADQRRLEALNEAAAQMAAAQAALQTEKANLERTRAELDAKQDQLDGKQNESAELLTELNAKGEEYEELLRESEAQKEQFSLSLASMQNAYNDALYQEWLATSVAPETQATEPAPATTESTTAATEPTEAATEPTAAATEPETTPPEESGETEATEEGGETEATEGTEATDTTEGTEATEATEPTEATEETEPTQPASSAYSGWLYPLPYRAIITDPYGVRESHPIYGDTRMHYGVDLGAARGTAIYASKGGVVTAASSQWSYGNYVKIDHADNCSSIYMHMTNYIVSYGQYVTQGQIIGYVGDTGQTTGPHLHFEIIINGNHVNPMEFV